MTISVGDRLPDATLLQPTAGKPEPVALADRLRGRKVAIFAVPGAFTGTCSTAHVPSFIRAKPGFDAKGVDEVICISVNDPHVMKAWGASTGATEAGLTFLADADGSFTHAMGEAFDAPAGGMFGRSNRYALYAEDGVVRVFQKEETNGACTVSGGEALLAAI